MSGVAKRNTNLSTLAVGCMARANILNISIRGLQIKLRD
jgi:hypothetical protein